MMALYITKDGCIKLKEASTDENGNLSPEVRFPLLPDFDIVREIPANRPTQFNVRAYELIEFIPFYREK